MVPNIGVWAACEARLGLLMINKLAHADNGDAEHQCNSLSTCHKIYWIFNLLEDYLNCLIQLLENSNTHVNLYLPSIKFTSSSISRIKFYFKFTAWL